MQQTWWNQLAETWQWHSVTSSESGRISDDIKLVSPQFFSTLKQVIETTANESEG